MFGIDAGEVIEERTGGRRSESPLTRAATDVSGALTLVGRKMPASLISLNRKPATSRDTPTTVTRCAGVGGFVLGRRSGTSESCSSRNVSPMRIAIRPELARDRLRDDDHRDARRARPP